MSIAANRLTVLATAVVLVGGVPADGGKESPDLRLFNLLYVDPAVDGAPGRPIVSPLDSWMWHVAEECRFGVAGRKKCGHLKATFRESVQTLQGMQQASDFPTVCFRQKAISEIQAIAGVFEFLKRELPVNEPWLRVDLFETACTGFRDAGDEQIVKWMKGYPSGFVLTAASQETAHSRRSAFRARFDVLLFAKGKSQEGIRGWLERESKNDPKAEVPRETRALLVRRAILGSGQKAHTVGAVVESISVKDPDDVGGRLYQTIRLDWRASMIERRPVYREIDMVGSVENAGIMDGTADFVTTSGRPVAGAPAAMCARCHSMMFPNPRNLLVRRPESARTYRSLGDLCRESCAEIRALNGKRPNR